MKEGGTEMKAMMFAAAFVLAACSAAFAADDASAQRGKAHFENPAFAGGRRACVDCHAGGRGLEDAGNKTVFHIMGGTQQGLEEAVNVCIVRANKGQAIPVDSREMKDIVSYIISFGRTPGK